MVNVEKNTFYRRQLIGNSVKLFPRFKDYSTGKDTTVFFEGGMNPTKYCVSGAVASAPSYGGGDLSGGMYQFFVSGTILSGSNTLPKLEAYKVSDGVGPTESQSGSAVYPAFEFAKYNYNGTYPGTYNTDGSPVGSNVFVMSSFLDGDSVWLEENFDGADKTLGTFNLIQDQGTATLSLKDAYLTPQIGEEKIFAGGDAFFGGGASDDVSTNLRKYFSDNPSGDGGAKVMIRPVKKGKINGMWTAIIDRRNKKQKWQIYAPFWKWKDIAGVVQFGAQTPATDDIDAAKEAGENNTIFNHIARSSPYGNVFTASAEKPLLDSVVELSTTKKDSGGQSLRMYHIWQSLQDVNSDTQWATFKNIEKAMGKQTINPQVAKCAIYNIPQPAVIDIGAYNHRFNTGTATTSQVVDVSGMLSGAHLSDKRVTFGEINMKMNISQLYPSPQIATGTASFGASGVIYSCPNATTSTSDTWMAKDFANNDAVFSTSKGGLNTFLRCVAVTFSNYKPEDSDTLDEFLDKSLSDQMKNSQTSVPALAEGAIRKVACGVVFQSFYGSSEYSQQSGLTDQPKDQDIDTETVYASAIPMMRYNTAAVSGAGGLLASGGLAKFDGTNVSGGSMLLVRDARIGLSQLGGLSDTGVGGGACSIGQGIYTTKTTCTGANGTWRDYKLPRYMSESTTLNTSGMPWGDSGSLHEPLFVKINKDSWFNMKVVMDPNIPFGSAKPWDSSSDLMTTGAAGGTYSHTVGSGTQVYTGSNDYNVGGLGDIGAYKNDFGVPIRVYFEGASVAGIGTTDDSDKQLPYLNLPIHRANSPIYGTSSDEATRTANGTTLLNGNNLPKHMTIWVQNYRFTQYSSDDSTGDYTWWRGQYYDSGTVANAEYRAADSKIYPDGLDAEAEVYIDNITFKNFNNEHVNHTIGAGQLQRFIQLGHTEVATPVATYYDHATSMTAMTKGYNNSGSWFSQNPGHYLLFGYDNPKDLPISGNSSSSLAASTEKVGIWGDGGETTANYGNDFGRVVYQLWNNFSTGDLGNLKRTKPDLITLSQLPYMNSSVLSSPKGFIPYRDGGYKWRYGFDFFGRTLAVRNPVVSGAAGVGATGTRDEGTNSLNNEQKLVYSGWVINNHGAAQTSNQAGWLGIGDPHAPTTALFTVSGGSYTDESVTVYPGFAQVSQAEGVEDYSSNKGSYVSWGSGTASTFYSTDMLTQKGFVKYAIDNTSNTGSTAGAYGATGFSNGALNYDTMSRWAPREHILASAKILGVKGSPIVGGGSIENALDSNTKIVVDNPEIFSKDSDDNYILFLLYGGAHGDDAERMCPNDADNTGKFPDFPRATTDATSRALGYHTTVKLAATEQPIQGNTIELAVFNSGSSEARESGILYADDGTTELGTEANLYRLFISPKKYWICMSFLNTDAASKRTYESVCNTNSQVLGISGTAGEGNQLGSTYNEFTYSYNVAAEASKGESGLLANPWILEPNEEQCTLDLADYGYGGFDKETDTGGNVGEHSILNNRLQNMDISPAVNGGGMMGGGISMGGAAPSDKPIVLAMSLSNTSAQKKVICYGEDFDSQISDFNYDPIKMMNPAFIWSYSAPLPSISQFTVSPAFNAVSGRKGSSEEINLYELTNENMNALNFTWAENGILWYRMLMIDEVPIRNKYHKAKYWLPLNTTGSDTSPTTAASMSWYSDASSSLGLTSGSLTVGAQVLQDIQGLQGYAPHLVSGTGNSPAGYIGAESGAADTFMHGLEGMSEYTLVAHFIPDDEDSNRDSTCLMSQGVGSGTGFDMFINTSQKLVIRQQNGTMTGTSNIPTDGETPTSVIVTYKNGSSAASLGPDMQLFINGRREDYLISGSGNVAADADIEFILGCEPGSSPAIIAAQYKGTMEEVIIYEKRWDIVPSGGSYIYNTIGLDDLTTGGGGKAKTHNAKMFLFDHHNIRGKNKDEVCASDLVSWRTTA